MHLHSFRLKNFRRLKDVHVELERDLTIFVGANNSGKTSATHAFRLFVDGSSKKFTIHDFAYHCWRDLKALGEQDNGTNQRTEKAPFPAISLDLWFKVRATDLHRVIDLLPSLAWDGSFVGLRIEFGPSDEEKILARFREAKAKAVENIPKMNDAKVTYHPWPNTLFDYLTTRLTQEFELRYYVLDRAAFDDSFRELPGYAPPKLALDNGRTGAHLVKALIRVDFLDAQRHLSDGASKGREEDWRAEDISRLLSSFYKRNLDQCKDDYTTLRALADSKEQLNAHLETVFKPILDQLNTLGYPGLSNPQLLIKSALEPDTVMSSHGGARVHYGLGDRPELAEYSLPDRYNGLGFKNLIYMVVEILDLHEAWKATKDDRPSLHLIFIEEPEAHLHAQLQQVFISKVLDLPGPDTEDLAHYVSQFAITTHSAHIVYERGFQPIRYFRRASPTGAPISEVLNLSRFYQETPDVSSRDFLTRYMKLTHCDLFFADAAILVEGNVERLLMPLMIEKVAKQLKASYLSVLDVGGAFIHCFQKLIEFLGITTLIVTDIDSIKPRAPKGKTQSTASDDDDGIDDAPGGNAKVGGSACSVNTTGAVTSNQTLRKWLPRMSSIEDLCKAKEADKIQEPTAESQARICVAYQTPQPTTWKGETSRLAGRTLEEAFALENLVWCHHRHREPLGLFIRRSDGMTLGELSKCLFEKVRSDRFKKTDFALHLLAESRDEWVVPGYIREGLSWLANQLDPSAAFGAPAGSPPPVTEGGLTEPEAGSRPEIRIPGRSVPPPAEIAEPAE